MSLHKTSSVKFVDKQEQIHEKNAGGSLLQGNAHNLEVDCCSVYISCCLIAFKSMCGTQDNWFRIRSKDEGIGGRGAIKNL